MLLVCHAEGMVNRYGNLSAEDSGLTAQGWKQADALADWLKKHYVIDVLVSTPSLRNRLTAQRVGQAMGLPVTVHQGLPSAPDEADGESVAAAATDGDFCTDLAGLIERLAGEYAQKTVALFLDATVISQALACIFDAASLQVDVDYSSVTELTMRADRWRLVCVNRRQHLPMPELARSEQVKPAGGVAEPPEALAQLTSVYNSVVAAAVDSGDEARHKRLEDFIEFADLPAGSSVLDLGAGTGGLAMQLAKRADVTVVGIDISPAMLERAELERLQGDRKLARRVDFRLAAAQQLPFRNERFDAVTCRLMLHLNRKPERILAEIWRVLKPGGILVLADLRSDDDPVKRATQNAIEEKRNPAHIAARSKQQYRDLVAEAGFAINEEAEATFERALDEWLAEFPAEDSQAIIVREMIEASIETDAAGIQARREGEQISFKQYLYYIRAVKPAPAAQAD
ncbi:MAG: methyltransferase domain-containing protein [Caldilineaceae bacterium]